MTKQEAANFLGVSTRAIERYTTANKLHVTYRQRPTGGQEASYDPAEVTKLKEARQQGIIDYRNVAPESRQPDTLTRSDEDQQITQIAPNALVVIERIANALEQQTPAIPRKTISLAEKLTLSLADATALAGLSEGWLRKAIKDGQLRAAKRGRGWNIKRVDLEAYVRKL